MELKKILNDIPNPFPFAVKHLDIPWGYLASWLNENNSDLNPEYQRGYVWKKEQKIAYIEYCLRGGMSGKEVYFNLPNMKWGVEKLECVDGQQRIKTILEFLDSKIPVFGGYVYNNFSDLMKRRLGSGSITSLSVNINEYTNPEDVVRWYISLNTGGTMHTKDDIKKAMDFLKKLKK